MLKLIQQIQHKLLQLHISHQTFPLYLVYKKKIVVVYTKSLVSIKEGKVYLLYHSAREWMKPAQHNSNNAFILPAGNPRALPLFCRVGAVLHYYVQYYEN